MLPIRLARANLSWFIHGEISCCGCVVMRHQFAVPRTHVFFAPSHEIVQVKTRPCVRRVDGENLVSAEEGDGKRQCKERDVLKSMRCVRASTVTLQHTIRQDHRCEEEETYHIPVFQRGEKIPWTNEFQIPN